MEMEAVRRSLTQRMTGAAKLRIEVYEEVEADQTATAQAALVVGIVALAAGIGGVGGGTSGFLVGLVAAYLGWLVWAGLTYLIGDKLLGGTATWGELLRTLGFAQSPGVLLPLALVPGLGRVIYYAIMIWLLIAGIIAIRQALDFTTGKAVATALLGWLAIVLLRLAAGYLAGPGIVEPS